MHEAISKGASLDMAEWICNKAHSRHGNKLSHGNLLHSCFRSLSDTFELLFIYDMEY